MLDKIFKYHERWIQVVKSYGEIEYAEDVVQEMYIKLINVDEKKLIRDGVLNFYYIRLTLRSLTMDLHRVKARTQRVDIESIGEQGYTEDLSNEAYGIFLRLLEEETNTWDWYDKLMWNTYSLKNYSMQKIADGSKIGKSSVFQTLSSCKERLNDALKESWEDYSNEDYELL